MKKIFNVIGICATVVLCVCIVSCDSGDYSFDDEITTKTENHEIQEDTIITDIAYSLFDDSIHLPVNVIFTYGTNYNHDYFKFDPAYKDTIKQAVEETTVVVMMKNDNLANSYYASACVVNADDNYYYVRYGSKTLDETKLQQIPKSLN